MKLENQVITFEQAQHLRELGVNAKSLFSWLGASNRQPNRVVYYSLNADAIPAYTLSELNAAIGKKYSATTIEGALDYLLHLLEGELLTADTVNKRINKA